VCLRNKQKDIALPRGRGSHFDHVCGLLLSIREAGHGAAGEDALAIGSGDADERAVRQMSYDALVRCRSRCRLTQGHGRPRQSAYRSDRTGYMVLVA
jgi:hypothetical protein